MTIDTQQAHTATVGHETIHTGDRVAWNTDKTQLSGTIVHVRPDFYITETDSGHRTAVRHRDVTKEGP